MKIAILLQGRFPTEKAYGITTIGTLKSLVDLGHETKIFSLNSSYNTLEDEVHAGMIVNYSENKLLSRLRKIAQSGIGLKSKVAWKLYWDLSFKFNRGSVKRSYSDVFWVREPNMLRMIPEKSTVILEIHRSINLMGLKNIKKQIKRGSIVLAPISKQLETEVINYKLNTKIVLAPMGIDLNQLESIEEVSKYLLRLIDFRKGGLRGLRVGYIGKFAPNGYSKGVEDLIALASLSKAMNIGYEISLTGGDSTEIHSMDTALKEFELMPGEIIIEGHLEHAQAIRKYREMDVIVLTKPKSEKYLGFPLKALESVASGRIVVAARCQVYEDVFSGDFKPYWFIPGDVVSLNAAILQAVHDPHIRERILDGIDYCRSYTWDSRVLRILGQL